MNFKILNKYRLGLFFLSCLLSAFVTVQILPAAESTPDQGVDQNITEEAPDRGQMKIIEEAKADLDKQEAQAALEQLDTWQGKDHSLHQLLLGHAYRLLENNAAAISAYQACLALNASVKPAAMSLIDLYASTEDWNKLKPLLVAWVDLDSDPIGLIKITIYCARELKDLRWAEAVAQRALLRFPSDNDLRRLDIALLIDAERWDEAQFAVKQAIAVNPNDVRLWQYLAFIYQSLDKIPLALAASEAAMLIEPQNKELARNFAQAQLAAGHANEALKQLKILVTDQTKDLQLLQIAAQAAYAAQDYNKAQQWIEQLEKINQAQPADSEDRLSQQAQNNMARLSLRALVDTNNYQALDKRSDDLLARAVLDADTILWLAQDAEQREKFARAEMLYQFVRKSAMEAENPSAKQSDNRSVGLATLYLARLWYKQGRKQDAQNLVSQHLKQHPMDDYARRLQTLMQ